MCEMHVEMTLSRLSLSVVEEEESQQIKGLCRHGRCQLKPRSQAFGVAVDDVCSLRFVVVFISLESMAIRCASASSPCVYVTLLPLLILRNIFFFHLSPFTSSLFSSSPPRTLSVYTLASTHIIRLSPPLLSSLPFLLTFT